MPELFNSDDEVPIEEPPELFEDMPPPLELVSGSLPAPKLQLPADLIPLTERKARVKEHLARAREARSLAAKASAEAQAQARALIPSGASSWALSQERSRTLVLPSWLQDVPSCHKLVFTGGFVACT